MVTISTLYYIVSLSKITDCNYGGQFLRLLFASLLVSQCVDYCTSTVSLRVGFYYVSIRTLLVTVVLASLSLELVFLPSPISLLQNQFIQTQKRTC